ncbi:putative diguanylate cyclase AdrA [Stenotrophomonas lactitubi]|nr:putative diguanylate cyclase AdrA [Stenotrophomonas lactitubi]
MIVDSLLGGAWIAFMALSTVPSALFAALLVADKIAAGGIRLATRATLALVAGFVIAWLALGLPFQPVTSQRTIVLSLPFLFVYGIGLSVLSWRLARRVKSQNRQLQRLSRMDPLVELANRGFLIQRAQQVPQKGPHQGAPVGPADAGGGHARGRADQAASAGAANS